MSIDPYSVLGLERGASLSDIKRAYRRATSETHPDRPGGDAERFRLATWAYEALTDPDKREVEAPKDALRRGADRRQVLTISPACAFTGGAAFDGLGRQVRIPPDTGVGDELRLVGLGGPGHPAGDLIITIAVAVAAPWQIHDLDLVGHLPLTWLELYRGKTVQLRTWGPMVTFPVGPRTPPLSIIELPGMGLRRGDERGSLRLVVVPVSPDPGDSLLESLLLRLQHEQGDRLREGALRHLDDLPHEGT